MSNKIAKTLTLIGALLSGFIGMVLVLPLGLVVPQFIIFPLALGMIALLSALGAGWAGNMFASDQSYSRLLLVTGLTEIVAVGLALVLGAILMLGGPFGPLIITFGIGTIIIALAATVATWRYRGTKRDLARDGLLTGGLIVLSVLIVAGVLFLASLFGLVGA